ncbi:MAG: phosphoribosylglycinamide formyltransferase [Candidatus Marinimicrobia bacterium]|nr:phosphoribosylglycinamide formyltransferase [Candidatus Neomarinimicrobiota bacterium]
MNIAVFASGRGSNFQAIYAHIKSGKINANVRCLISNNPSAPVIGFAKNNRIQTYIIDAKDDGHSKQLLEVLDKHNTQLIVLAGYMKLIQKNIVKKFHNKIINIHPSLLPSFGGKGCYGMNVHEKVFKSGVKYTGATVHYVNQNYDEGQIIAQEHISISPEDSAENIATKVLKIEHKLLPEVVKKICENQLYWINNKPWISKL